MITLQNNRIMTMTSDSLKVLLVFDSPNPSNKAE